MATFFFKIFTKNTNFNGIQWELLSLVQPAEDHIRAEFRVIRSKDDRNPNPNPNPSPNPNPNPNPNPSPSLKAVS
ncbi:hypothetical protein Saga11_38790 [Bacillus safensis]|nr:hypothetical protein Saga11_38790 [Bacillus safensis]